MIILIQLSDLLHVLAGFAITGIAIFAPGRSRIPAFLFFLICLAIAIGKEQWWDESLSSGVPSFSDFWLTTLSGAIGACWVWSKTEPRGRE